MHKVAYMHYLHAQFPECAQKSLDLKNSILINWALEF